jgi:hypothetical protein
MNDGRLAAQGTVEEIALELGMKNAGLERIFVRLTTGQGGDHA